MKIFNDLISRGLKRVLVIVSDDFPGLSEVIKTLFPNSEAEYRIKGDKLKINIETLKITKQYLIETERK
jgi:hypothetical protein